MAPVDYVAPDSAVIKHRQNEPAALRLLIAQRRLYTRAKAWQGIRWVGVLVLGIAAPFISLLLPGAAVTIGAISGVWLFIGRTLLTVLEARTMVKAACIQEELDQLLFGMPVTIARSERPEPEEIALLSGREDRIHQVAEKENLLDWYPIDPSDPGAVTVAIAQRSNASYTGRLIRTTVITWAAAAVLWIAILMVWAAASEISPSNFLLGALFPVLPAVLDVSEYLLSTWKAARDRSDLAATIAARLSPGRPTVDGQELLVWQERLFDLRRTTPQIPNWLYRITRRRNEQAMHSAAATLRHNNP